MKFTLDEVENGNVKFKHKPPRFNDRIKTWEVVFAEILSESETKSRKSFSERKTERD